MSPDEMCENGVAFERFWPGEEPDFVCLGHAIDTQKLADVFGLDGVLRPITIAGLEQLDRAPACACTKGRVQEVFTGGGEL